MRIFNLSPILFLCFMATNQVTHAADFDISGEWNSSIGVTYQIKQSDSAFGWWAKSLSQTAEGSVHGQKVMANWSNASGRVLNASGLITQVDKSGTAQRIDWDNGVTFVRARQSTTPEDPSSPPGATMDPLPASIIPESNNQIEKKLDDLENGQIQKVG